jgi:hypothetical protein
MFILPQIMLAFIDLSVKSDILKTHQENACI